MTKQTAAAAALTVADIEAALENDEYLGFGYLSERRYALNAGRSIAAGDALALELANGLGWTSDQFFTWLNSKNGRWFGELAFGNNSPAVIRDRVAAWHLMVL
jgi:hypothetical protein